MIPTMDIWTRDSLRLSIGESGSRRNWDTCRRMVWGIEIIEGGLRIMFMPIPWDTTWYL